MQFASTNNKWKLEFRENMRDIQENKMFSGSDTINFKTDLPPLRTTGRGLHSRIYPDELLKRTPFSSNMALRTKITNKGVQKHENDIIGSPSSGASVVKWLESVRDETPETHRELAWVHPEDFSEYRRKLPNTSNNPKPHFMISHIKVERKRPLQITPCDVYFRGPDTGLPIRHSVNKSIGLQPSFGGFISDSTQGMKSGHVKSKHSGLCDICYKKYAYSANDRDIIETRHDMRGILRSASRERDNFRKEASRELHKSQQGSRVEMRELPAAPPPSPTDFR